MKKGFFLFFFFCTILLSENIDELLQQYKAESELSKITKSDSAGFVDVFTRDDLEKMQVKTLGDIFKLFTVPFVSRTPTGVINFIKPTMQKMPNTAIRLFINDKPTVSGLYGSTAKMYSNYSLEHVDHIEVYKTASSIEFGGEPGTLIIKIYTKLPNREEGGKIRISADNYGSTFVNGYYAQTVSENFSYLIFADTYNLKNKTYYYQNSSLDSDSDTINFFTSLDFYKWKIDVSHYKRLNDPFLGKGINYTPEPSDGLTSSEDYIFIKRKFDNEIAVKFLYSNIEITEDYADNGGIYAGKLGIVQKYHNSHKDKHYYFSISKNFKTEKNELFAGIGLKQDSFTIDTILDGTSFSYDNQLRSYSVYGENSYYFNKNTKFILSYKKDFYNYKKEVKDKNNYIARVGIIKNLNNFQIKAFYTRSYYLNPISMLYSGGYNAPAITNPDLKNPKQELKSIGVKYKEDKSEIEFRVSFINVKDYVIYDKIKGYLNLSDKKHYRQYEIKALYRFSLEDRMEFTFFGGDNGNNDNYSPNKGAVIRIFNTYKKFDFYNEILYKSSYSLYGINVRESFDVTTAVKYRYTDDLSFGLRAENIFNDSYKQIYKNLPFAIPVNDRKIWINMEYLF